MNKKTKELLKFELAEYGLLETILFGLSNIYHSEELYSLQLILRLKKYNRKTNEEKQRLFSKLFELVMGVKPNIDKPRTFSEKIQWIKLYGITPEMTMLADKYAVRQWVEERIGSDYLVPLLGAWDKYEDIDFGSLPEQFCLKTNHGSAMNYPVPDKKQLDINDLKSKFNSWMKRPYEMVAYEMHYASIPRKIIAEKYINELNGNLYDYKFHCFGGRPIFIQCIGERDLVKHTAYHNHYSLDWEELDWNFECFPRFPYTVQKPNCLEEMIDVVERLAEGFSYVRVDLYEINGKVFFGEMTFTPGSGMYPYKKTWNYERDTEIGSMFEVC